MSKVTDSRFFSSCPSKSRIFSQSLNNLFLRHFFCFYWGVRWEFWSYVSLCLGEGLFFATFRKERTFFISKGRRNLANERKFLDQNPPYQRCRKLMYHEAWVSFLFTVPRVVVLRLLPCPLWKWRFGRWSLRPKHVGFGHNYHFMYFYFQYLSKQWCKVQIIPRYTLVFDEQIVFNITTIQNLCLWTDIIVLAIHLTLIKSRTITYDRLLVRMA